MQAATSTAEPWGPLNALVSELARGAGLGARLLRRAFRSRTRAGSVELGPGRAEREHPATDAKDGQRPELVVCASGNLALVYLNPAGGRPERLTLEDLEELYPGLVEALAGHEGIGFVMVRSREAGAVVLGRAGRHFLDGRVDEAGVGAAGPAEGADQPAVADRVKGADRVEGVDPLAPFGRQAADDLRRLDAMPNVGDLVLNSRLDPDTQEVAAFEELVGSHGGLGGWQTRAFLLHPIEWPLPAGRLVGAPAVYRQLVAWLEGAGAG